MKEFFEWFFDTRFYLQVFCGYEFTTVRSQHLCRMDDVWQNNLMINGWDVHRIVEVGMFGKYYAVFHRMPLTEEFVEAAKELEYDCTGDEFYLMGMRGEIDWSRQPSWVYFSEDFREIFNIK